MATTSERLAGPAEIQVRIDGGGVAGGRPVVPAGLPPVPPARPGRRLGLWGAAAVYLFGMAPLLMMGVSLLIGGGPRAESADDALLTMAMRDASHGHGLVGAYSRFGWHHPGPAYLYLAGVPTRLWGGGPTGSWIGAVGLALMSAVGTVWLLRRWAGPVAGWWGAVTALAIFHGLGPNLFRDPWNPYAVILPMLFTGVACAFAAAGKPGALGWAAVGGTLAIQTHVSTAPVVVLLGALAVVAGVLRRGRGWAPAGSGAGFDIPAGLPGYPAARWVGGVAELVGRCRTETLITSTLVLAAWLPPLWDEAFGSHNLTAMWDFFTSPHPTHGWAESWRLTTAVFGIVLFQHHAALHDLAADPHPVVTALLFVGLSVLAIVLGIRRARPAALWLGAGGLASGVACVYSVTKVVGFPYRYLLVWMAAVAVMPIVGVVVGLAGGRGRWPLTWWRVGAGVTAAAVGMFVIAGVDAVLAAPPAAALTDKDIATAWRLVAPVVGGGHAPVHLQLDDGARWPSAAGLALELERHGHPARVDQEWTLLFGAGRRARGDETRLIVISSTADPGTWPSATDAHLLGVAGKARYFVGGPGVGSL